MADEKFSNFLTEIIDADLAEGKVKEIHTRFPPEPNGYLHIGSAKAIYINYMTAKTYGGKFNLRFDDTNPAREGDEYVQSILKDLEWLGATPNGGIFYGSDYFEKCYEYAEKLIQEGKAYVDDLTREEMQEYRGNDAGKPSRPSPYRDRTPEENIDLFRYYIDPIGHNPYALISYLTAMEINFDYDADTQARIQELFNALYTLEVESVHEVRSYQYTTTDEEGNEVIVTVYYDYYILNVTLTANDWDSVVKPKLEAAGVYDVYLLLQETQGNKPDLF